jgi:high-affinity iron transporter
VVTATIAVTTLLSAAVPAAGASIPDRSATHPAGAAHAIKGQRIVVTTTTCAPRWHAPNPGRAHFALANRSNVAATMYLFHPRSEKIVATVKGIKAHTVRALVVKVKRGGHYVWGCDLKGRPPRVSDVQTVPRDPTHGGTGPVVVPLGRRQLVPAMKGYRAYVVHELHLLTAQTNALAADLAASNASAARSDWLTAHQTWLRIGQDDGAYGAFGNLGREIDGTTAGLVHGTSDPDFTGFHKVEYDLWTKGGITAAASDTTTLVKNIARLTGHPISSWFPFSAASVSGLPLRCHEILEDGLRDSLSGDDDYGSGTSIASVRADVTGTREVLRLLTALLKPRSPHLAAHARRALTRLAAALEATRSDGHWVAVADLSRHNREEVDSAIGNALEILAPVPDLLTIGKS